MTAEDDLRVLLRTAAGTVVPAGDGLSVIRQRIARRRRLRLFAVPSAGALALGVAAALFLTGGGGTDTLVAPPASQGPSATPTERPYTGPSLLAFTSPDKGTVVRRWLALVGVAGVPEQHTCESCDVVGIAVAGKHVGDAHLARSDQGLDRQFVLVSVSNDELAVTLPAPFASPARISGTLSVGVDESVLLRLLTPDGRQLGQTSAPAGSAVPWSGSLTWSDTGWSRGEVVATTSSPKDGAVTRLVALAVSG